MFWQRNKKLFFWYTLLTKGLNITYVQVEVEVGMGPHGILKKYSYVPELDLFLLAATFVIC